ncbi:Transcription factor cbf11 [Mycena venus]|uniref:Transcription factor cbf11 n=1 Tax=Mycena venus TaxID=2733690 RepID=A0A8H6XWN3_9AGAR|nr:Transcription factor cbf11 [Mycena venus]
MSAAAVIHSVMSPPLISPRFPPFAGILFFFLCAQQKQPSPRPTPQNPPDITPSAPTGSLQSILATPPTQAPNWPGSTSHENGNNAPLSQPAPSKRKLDSADADDPHSKIRRIVRDHVSQDPSRVMPMTTVVCLHAAVAQKSYGSEKRFLCPPPVVHIEGPVWQMRRQELSMTVVSEIGERSFEQKAPLDNNMTASFKFLHVTGTAKAKSFQLSLEIAEPGPPPAIEGADPPPGRVWATFDSAPVTIISKPSKKTAKTRNISSCILAGGPVSLFNRINSQTVRTKYMTIDHAQLCASNIAWSAFNVNVVPRATDPPSIGGPQPVTYGCSIILSDTHSGISTSPLIIRKVDKGRVSPDDGGPVSQMQKIALQRVNPDGSRHYLSAAGPIPGTQGVVAPPAPGSSAQAGSHPLLFQSPRVRDEVKDGVRVITDDVDDYLCWTIVGISKFQYTFFDAFGQNNTIPDLPITPFPTLFTPPVYRQANNTIELTVANFFYADPTTGAHTPLDVYLGNLGPLRHRVYQATPPGPLTTISPFINRTGGNVMDTTDPAPASPPSPVAPRFSGGPLHAIVIVEMPALADVIKALEEDALPASSDDAPSTSRPSPPSENAQPNGAHPAPSIAGRSLPLLFIRPIDGVGYHSGRTIACENVFQSLEMGANPAHPGGNVDTGWLQAAQAAASADGGLHGWTLRVM